MESYEFYRKYFINRDDCFAVQKEDGSYARVNRQLTEMDFTDYTVATYMLDKENKVKCACIDIDITKETLKEHTVDEYRKDVQGLTLKKY